MRYAAAMTPLIAQQRDKMQAMVGIERREGTIGSALQKELGATVH